MTTATPAYDELAAHLVAPAPPGPPAVAGRLGPGGEHAAQGQRGARRGDGRDGRRCCTACAPTRSSADQLGRAEQEPLSDLQRANLREMQRQWRASKRLPESLVQRQQMATSRCEHAWRTQRPANDWEGFLANFRDGARAGPRGGARCSSAQTGLSKYDALMDRYEPGMTCAQLDRVFGEVRQWLPGLIQRVVDQAGHARPCVEPVGPFPLAAQRALCEQVIAHAGLRFRGRPAGRQHAPLLRRRARGRAHDDALSRRRFPGQPDGHGPRDRPRPLRAEPAARPARPAGGARRARWRCTRARA